MQNFMWSPKNVFMCAGDCFFFFLRSHLVEKMGQLDKIEYLHNDNSANGLQPFIFNLSLPRYSSWWSHCPLAILIVSTFNSALGR